MNSSVQPSRRIASNLLWTPRGVVRNPLVGVAADGRILSVESCAEPDRLAFTEFWSGMLVPDFPADYHSAFTRLLDRPDTPLPVLLTELFRAVSADDLSVETLPAGVVSVGVIPAGTSPADGFFAGGSPGNDVSADVAPVGIFPLPFPLESRPAAAVTPAPERAPLPAPDSARCEAAPAAPAAGCLVVISGLDYPSLRLTPQSRIRLLARSR